MAKGWEIKRVARSERNGAFQIEGVNHETTDPLFRSFYWNVRTLWDDQRYWFAADVEIDASALPLLVSNVKGADHG